jgi:hypothetical protein
MNGFKGWYLEAHYYLQQQVELSENLKRRIENSQTHVEKLEADLEKMVLINNSLLKESKDYFEQIENLRKNISHKKKISIRILNLILRIFK